MSHLDNQIAITLGSIDERIVGINIFSGYYNGL
jgi:hypothetical protein